ncbi:MAG TPA: BMP family ABC transporter substrate-binding protein [Thermoflexia bacterium]|nr:BMP family ABC transporter substrate-binding protein [Thermoflexia bacterium]
MQKKLWSLFSLMLVVSMLLAACATPTPEPTAAPAEETAEVVVTEEPEPSISVGMVTDMGGVDDKSFNATSWKGVERAIEELNVDGSYLESQQQTDYATNITQFVKQGTDLIITVGFMLADDTAKFAEEYPDTNFAIVDYSFGGAYDNVRGLTFATDQAGFLAGYTAAAASKTGKIATFGGINIPPVTIFMVGFETGAQYYNEQHGTQVEVLGWNSAENNGVFVGNFESTDDGRRVAEEFLSEGADVIMPVAGPVGLGSAQAVKEQGNAWIVGVDTDWVISAPEYAEIVLTSVMKNMDVAVFNTAKKVADESFKGFHGETYVGSLENNGVGIASVAAGTVSAEMLQELEDVKQAIIHGDVETGWNAYLENLGGESEEPEYRDIIVGMVTDMGGVDDKSFNATSWKGVERAIEELGVEGSYLESQQQTDYATNITQYMKQGTDLIVTVGFMLADDTEKFAPENPDINFAIVDYSFGGAYDNVRGLTFAIDEAGFLAGYAAAGASKTGKIATFGGINIPPVTQFMVGFEAGAQYYNEQAGAQVEVLGWNSAENNGVFVGNFDSTDDGRRVAEEFLSEGADVIMPVAGPVGLGSAQAIKEHGDAWIVGVDTDWVISAPEYAEIVLTSVMKNMDVAVFNTIKMVAAQNFESFHGETYLGSLENNGVGLSAVAAGAISDEAITGLEEAKQAIIHGDVTTGWVDYLANLSAE